MPGSRYERAILAARNAALALTQAQTDAFLRLLQDYADDLARLVGAATATSAQRNTLAVANEMLRQLSRDMAASTRAHVGLTADTVARIHANATAALFSASARNAVLATFGGIGASAAQAVLARPELARAFRTVRRTSVAAVDRILQRGLLRGASADQLERELRLHMLGAESLPARLLLDRRRIGYRAIQTLGYEPTRENLLAVRREAGQVANRARLIARTEPMNAELEAGVQAAIASPVVAAIQWSLSGRHPVYDQCDELAHGDWFGLGPGVYDPRAVPRRPHPRCLCLRTHVLRPPSEWGQERGPAPTIRSDAGDVIEGLEGLTPSQKDSLRSVLGGIPDRRVPPAIAPPPSAPPAPSVPLSGQSQNYASGHTAAVREALRRAEGQLQNISDPEWGIGINAQTGLELFRQTTNEKYRVAFTRSQLVQLGDNVLTHNHPSGASFSGADIALAVRWNLAEIRAVDAAQQRYVYSMRRPGPGWDPNLPAQLGDLLEEAVDAAERRLRAAGLSELDVAVTRFHEAWLQVAGRLGLQYRRESWGTE